VTVSRNSTPLPAASDQDRPVLHLSGPKLKACLQALIDGCDSLGGVERYVAALELKTAFFQEILGKGKAADLDAEDFKRLCVFMAPVRRRIGDWLAGQKFITLRDGLAALLDGAEDTAAVDARIAAFCQLFPAAKTTRWARDLATEVLHYVDPERYPLMCRWVWDAKANTGVIREIWYGDNVDGMVIDIPDGYETFLILREELSQFLADNGVFRDMLSYCDLLTAQIYADYICAQGGAFLRTDFASEEDPMQYTRRMLGLDGVKTGKSKTRLKDIDGVSFELEESAALPSLSGANHANS
jgi:hypothetical protein